MKDATDLDAFCANATRIVAKKQGKIRFSGASTYRVFPKKPAAPAPCSTRREGHVRAADPPGDRIPAPGDRQLTDGKLCNQCH
jgi:hypothetical protein